MPGTELDMRELRWKYTMLAKALSFFDKQGNWTRFQLEVKCKGHIINNVVMIVKPV